MRVLLLALCFASLAVAAGCKPREFVCGADTECAASNGGYGRCVVGHCAFRDEACASKWRWDDTAGDQSEECVPPEVIDPDAGVPQPDAAAADADTTDAPPPDGATADAATSD
jgi:hypothetical protein